MKSTHSTRRDSFSKSDAGRIRRSERRAAISRKMAFLEC
jgi:hypothetical protein